MPRYERFTFLCNEHERRLITNLAHKLQRSQSDAVRFVVINAARELCAQQRDSDNETLEICQTAQGVNDGR